MFFHYFVILSLSITVNTIQLCTNCEYSGHNMTKDFVLAIILTGLYVYKPDIHPVTIIFSTFILLSACKII